MPQPKTVYVIGAGFSRVAGFPLQSEILQQILRFDVDLMEAPRHAIDVFLPAQQRVAAFLGRVFRVDTPPLEDVFTLLDQIIARRESCAGYSWHQLDEIRDALKRAILFVFHQAGMNVSDEARTFYVAVGAYLLRKRVAAGQHGDPFAIISLNWDSLLEDSIYRIITGIGGHRKADVDYCCYTTPLGQDTPHTPSILQRAKGIFNVKVIKLHGSVNWLSCPNCNRLFTGVGGTQDVWDLYARPVGCPYCSNRVAAPEVPPLSILEPFFITPTFIKVFDNIHIQLAWHNAHIELSEAADVVFIGYSLPDADYYVRTLLRRSVRQDAKVTAVLTTHDEPRRNTPVKLRGMFALPRYRQFLGAGRIAAVDSGVEGYFQTLVGGRIDERRLRGLTQGARMGLRGRRK